MPENVVPVIFRTYSSNPKGPNFGLIININFSGINPGKQPKITHGVAKNQLMRFCSIVGVNSCQSPNGQSCIPDWFDKLQAVIQSREEEPSEEQETTWEEWMILSDLNTPFVNSGQTAESAHDWHLDRANYSKQQIQEMPTLIKTKREEHTVDEQYVVDINSFTKQQNFVYNIVKFHFDDTSSEKQQFCLIVMAGIHVRFFSCAGNTTGQI